MRVAIGLVVLLLGVPASARPAWQFVATFPAKRTEPVDVEATLSGFSGPVQLCTTRDGFGRYIDDVKAAGKRVSHDSDDSDCWSFHAAKQPLRISYRVDLNADARDNRDPDRAALLGDTFLFEEDAIVLSPAPRPEGDYTLEFRLPPGVDVEAPWERLSPTRFRSSWAQYQTGSYVAVGRLQRLADVPVRGGTFALTLIGSAGRATQETVRAWVSRAGTRVANFYQGLPAPRVEALLVPEDCADRGGLFGTTLHDGRPSVVLFFCKDAPAEAFGEDDWLGTHELFHLGNPSLKHRVPWFTEGAATYYQDVLRGRDDGPAAAKMWGDLYDGFRRFCAPVDGFSLREESKALHQRHRYQRIYWGAACLLFQVDVAIRRASDGKRSLDTVLRALLRRSRAEPLSEQDVLAALDAAAGAPIASEGLAAKQAVDLGPLYRELGIEPIGDDTVKLHDDAPLAGLRQAIMPAR